ncbi:MAG: S8 family serine peptidase, partial [Bdellovibrionales bacterium]|nr:S8 family serine peptidase [Bdellovibrionales bacterium]
QLAKTDDLLKTVYYAADNGAQVLNCSWGANQSPTSAERDAFSYALDMGLVVVVAAGNSAANARDFSPAGIAQVITVGSSNSLDELSSFSNYGTGVDVMAPGGDAPQYGGRDEKILSTIPGGKYVGQRGTSMASPYVAGLAALVLSINPALSNSEVDDLIKASADMFSVTVPRSSNLKYNYGRINARKAAEAALASLPQPDPAPECQPGQQCSQQGAGNPSARSSDISAAISSGFGGCGNEMRAKPRNSNKAEAPLAALLFPILILIILRRRRD